MLPDLPGQLASVTVLSDRVRRALYLHVAGQDGPVGRAAAAAAVGVPRTVAAFHLDRLVEAGLLDVTHGRTTERRGPGSGRPAKLYRYTALWWVPPGHLPSIAEAVERLAQLQAEGPGARAFTFQQPFPPPAPARPAAARA